LVRMQVQRCRQTLRGNIMNIRSHGKNTGVLTQYANSLKGAFIFLLLSLRSNENESEIRETEKERERERERRTYAKDGTEIYSG